MIRALLLLSLFFTAAAHSMTSGFHEDTLVRVISADLSPDHLPIKNIKVGDVVTSMDSCGAVVMALVRAVEKCESNLVISISAAGHIIHCAADQFFYSRDIISPIIDGKAKVSKPLWKLTAALRPMHTVLRRMHEEPVFHFKDSALIASITKTEVEEPLTFYRLVLDHHNNLFVTTANFVAFTPFFAFPSPAKHSSYEDEESE